MWRSRVSLVAVVFILWVITPVSAQQLPIVSTVNPTSDLIPIIPGGAARVGNIYATPHQLSSAAGMLQDASNATLPNALDNLSLGPVQDATMICTTTNGSTAVTGCNGTSYLAVGMIVSGPGITGGTTVASGITATGFTMSAVAGAAAGTGLVSAREAFWSDVDGGTPQIMRLSGRLMLGDAIGRTALRLSGTNFDYVPSATYGANWLPRDSQLAVGSTVGGIAVAGLSKSSLGAYVASPPATIGVAGYAICDASTAKSCWGLYSELAFSESTAGAKGWGLEVSPKNLGSLDGTSQPYAEGAGPTAIALRAGADGSVGGQPTAPINTGILISPGTGNAGDFTNYTFNKGIVFLKNALTGNDGTTGIATAIDMPRGDLISWTATNGQLGAYIYGDSSGASVQQSILMSDDITAIRGASAANILRARHNTGTTAVNYHEFYDGATGVAPRWAPAGTDSDIGLGIGTKGTGFIRFGSIAGTPAHLASGQTTAPALTSCGTGSPSIVGTDTAGTVTTGTNATGCVITFNVAYAAAPHCIVTWQTTPAASQSYTVAAGAITLTQTSASGRLVNYVCIGLSGG